MTRLLASLRREGLLLIRYKLVAVSVFVISFWILLLAFVPADVRPSPDRLVPAFVVVNLVTTTFYFVVGLVLFERGEGMLTALATTPLRTGEYLSARAVSLSLLAAVETLAVAFWFFGVGGWPQLVGGALFLGVIYTLLGLVAAARYDSINEFLLPSIVLVTLLQLPLLPHFDVGSWWAFFWHPILPGLLLLRSAYVPGVTAELVLGLVGSAVWIWLSYRWARHRFVTYVRAHG